MPRLAAPGRERPFALGLPRRAVDAHDCHRQRCPARVRGLAATPLQLTAAGIAGEQTQLRNKAVTRWIRGLSSAVPSGLQRANEFGVSSAFRAHDASNMFLTLRFFDVALNTAIK
jgi:hypothetical protein